MKTIIKCEDTIEVTKKDGKKKEVDYLYVRVSNEYTDELEVDFYGLYSFMGSPDIPIRCWAKVKDVVDRLIIKAEHLMKEDC